MMRKSGVPSLANKTGDTFVAHMRDKYMIGDGAMATVLHQTGVPVRTCFEALNLEAPELVKHVHQAYVEAGAQLLQTNTFSAHRTGLTRYGLEAQLADINRAAVAVAREAATAETWVFGTIGSVNGLHIPGSSELELTESLVSQFEEQAILLLDAGVDGIVLETFAELRELLIALEVVRRHTKLPIIANLSPDSSHVTRDGVDIGRAFDDLLAAGATVVGLNCRLGPSGILRSYEGLSIRPDVLYSAVPNAGLLHVVEGDYNYTGSADYFADTGVALYNRGVRLLGGCCGTTPSHIRSLSERVRKASQSPVQMAPPATSVHINLRTATPPPKVTGSGGGANDMPVVTVVPKLVRQVEDGITILVELDPPKSLDVAKYLAGAQRLQEAGADYITLADNSLGSVRVSNMALASILKGIGIEPLVHVTCRDRNLIGQQSHLMGLNVLDIHNILLVTGDPSRFGELPGATSVYDVSSMDLTRMVKRLNDGTAFSGQPLKKPSQFVIGTSFNPHVANYQKAIERLKRKVEAGADYVMTQPLYDERMFEQLAVATRDLGVPIFVGIMPLTSSRNALFLHNEVPGIRIPDEILLRMSNTTPEEVVGVGLSIAESLVDAALSYFRGIYLVTPFLRTELTEHLTRYIRCHEIATGVKHFA